MTPYKALCRVLAAVAAVLLLGGLSSCKTPKKMLYFEDIKVDDGLNVAATNALVIAPGDGLNIFVNSREPQLAAMFNQAVVTNTGAGPERSYNNQIATYTVGSNGDIDFPVLGLLHAAGLTRDELAAKIRQELTQRQLLPDPTVTVEFTRIYFTVSGEVKEAGRFPMDREDMTIIDAIAAAGDLSIRARRDNVKVVRREGDKQKVYVVDLTNGRELVESPVYFVHQNDVIYVTPNDTKLREATVNGNNVISTAFWLSLASVASTIAVLIFK